MKCFAIALSLSLLALPGLAQEPKPDDSMKDCPMHDLHAAHHAVVESHGDRAMGFPHGKTTHHFRMLGDGGAIEIAANDPEDKTNREAIRSHLAHIAMSFGAGDFSAPMFIRDGVPPGVTTMKLLKSTIHYAYQETPAGGRVSIESQDPIAVAAIHDFLRFQITDHQTDDALQSAQK